MDVKGVFARREILQIGFNGDSTAFFLAQNGGADIFAFGVLECHGYRFVRGIERRTE